MAAVDKIYGTKEQYYELQKYIAENKPEALPYLSVWFYTDEQTHVIALFPESVDMWLIENCPIKWVVDYIKDQYEME